MRRSRRRIGAALVVTTAALVGSACSERGVAEGQAVGAESGEEGLGSPGSTTPAVATDAAPFTTPETGCRPLAQAVTTGTVQDPSVTEVSGLAVGVRSPEVLFAVEDSGAEPSVLALGLDGRLVGRHHLAGAEAVDWEDVAVGPGPRPGVSYLYVGDIGDNARVRSSLAVYRVAEPDLSGDVEQPSEETLDGVARFDVSYPDGVPRDAEALLVDADAGEVLVVTKTLSTTSEVFRFHPGPEGTAVILVAAGTVEVPGFGIPMITGGSVSADGTWVALRTYDRVLRFHRRPGMTVAEALARSACDDPLPLQPQGEAIALTPDGGSVITTSEGQAAALAVQVVD